MPQSASSTPDADLDHVDPLTSLVRHFRSLESTVPQLEVASRWLTWNDSPADVESGILISHRRENGEGEVRLWVSRRRVKLKARWEDDGSFSELEERFTISLHDPPRWGGVRFDSMEAFTAALFGLMRRRLYDLPVSPDQISAPTADAPIPGEAEPCTAEAEGAP